MTCILQNKEPLALVNSMESYFKEKPPDCTLFSQDNFEFSIHKEVLYQTEYLCEMIREMNFESDCYKIEILCTSISREELQLMVNFLYTGKISCKDENLSSEACKNLSEVFGFPIFGRSKDKINGEIQLVTIGTIEKQKKKIAPTINKKYTQEKEENLKIDNDINLVRFCNLNLHTLTVP